MPHGIAPTFCILFAMSFSPGCSAETDGTQAPTVDGGMDMAGDAEFETQTDAGMSGDASASDGGRVGFEIIEFASPTNIRAWISPQITLEAFTALELPPGWLKNQPREAPECGADAARFVRSPDATMDGEILIQEHFGFNWFHAATVTEMNIPVDPEGLLEGVAVRKFHELTYNPGSCLVLLTDPTGDVYFRVGRDLNRMTDEPTLPEGWSLRDYITPETLVIELFDRSVVIRTDNEDSFQGPIPQLRDLP